jgi:hypothetical protein
VLYFKDDIESLQVIIFKSTYTRVLVLVALTSAQLHSILLI